MFALQPHSEVVKTHGESANRALTMTFSVLSPRTSFINLVKGSNSAFVCSICFFSSSWSISRPSLVVDFNFLSSNSLSCCTAYSSIGTHMYNTSNPFLLRASKKGADDTAATLYNSVPPSYDQHTPRRICSRRQTWKSGSAKARQCWHGWWNPRGHLAWCIWQIAGIISCSRRFCLGNLGKHLNAFVDHLFFDSTEKISCSAGVSPEMFNG